MALIDPEGLFGGDRLRACSDRARLLWPYLYLASNGFGRLELNYHRIIARCFSDFRRIPSEAELKKVLDEYQLNCLLFVYEAAGQVWGAWDTPTKNLPDYKTAADRRSPEPPEPEFSNWKRSYRAQKKPFAKLSLNASEKLSENFPLGIGVGVGKTCASLKNGDARVADPLSLITTPPSGSTGRAGVFLQRTTSRQEMAPEQELWWAAWWPAYWLHRAKKAAREAFRVKVKSQALFDQVMAATRAQTQEMLAREKSKRPHGATWLNGERWEDEQDRPTAAASDDYPELT